MSNEKTDRKSEIIHTWEAALTALQKSNLKADREHAAKLARRRDSGAFKPLAYLIVFIEDIFSPHDIPLVSTSQTTLSRYYGRHSPHDPVIRVSDHAKINQLSNSNVFEVSCLIHEDMTEDDIRKAAEKAINDLASMEQQWPG